MARPQFTIRYRKDRNTWVFDVFEHGHRRQLSFPTRKSAQDARDSMLQELDEFGRRSTNLTPQERIEFADLRNKLTEHGSTIREAVDFFLRHRPAGGKRIRVQEAIEEYVREELSRPKPKITPKTLKNYEHAWKMFVRDDFGTQFMDDIASNEISDFLQSHNWSPKTQVSYRTNLSVLWQWSIGKGYAQSNPAHTATIDQVDVEGDVARFSVEQCAGYLRAAVERDPEFVPYVVLSLFCGLRPAELEDDRIDAKSGNPPVYVSKSLEEVIVMGAKRRSRRRRPIRLQPCVKEWLREWPVISNPVAPVVNFRRRWETIRPEPWVQDGPRHTFASMHLRMFSDERWLQIEMGHQSAHLIFSTYRGLAEIEEAEAFWNLTPSNVLAP